MSRNSLLLAASLLALTFIDTHRTSAQVSQGDPFPRVDGLMLEQPFVLAGPDVGFRVIRMDGQIPVGRIVIRIDGVWVAAETAK